MQRVFRDNLSNLGGYRGMRRAWVPSMSNEEQTWEGNLAVARIAETCSACQKRVPIGELKRIGQMDGKRYRLCKVCINDWTCEYVSFSYRGPLHQVWTVPGKK